MEWCPSLGPMMMTYGMEELCPTEKVQIPPCYKEQLKTFVALSCVIKNSRQRGFL